MRFARPAGTLLIAAIVLPMLSGCGTVALLLPVRERSGTAADPRALELAWSTPASPPTWIPDDARSIRWIASTLGGADDAPAAVRLRSAQALPEECVEDAGTAAPGITADWMPARTSRVVQRCGNWAVVPVRGGYSAWTPVSAPSS